MAPPAATSGSSKKRPKGSNFSAREEVEESDEDDEAKEEAQGEKNTKKMRKRMKTGTMKKMKIGMKTIPKKTKTSI